MGTVARGYADPTHADESSSDLVQEAWVRAWQRLDQFQGGGTDEETLKMLRGWVGQIVHRLGLNRSRDRAAQKRSPEEGVVLSIERGARSGLDSGQGTGIDPPGSEPTPSAIVSLNEETRRVHAAIESIADPMDRSIVRLRFFEGASLKRIAEMLGLSYDKVRNRFDAALREIERKLEGPS